MGTGLIKIGIDNGPNTQVTAVTRPISVMSETEQRPAAEIPSFVMLLNPLFPFADVIIELPSPIVNLILFFG